MAALLSMACVSIVGEEDNSDDEDKYVVDIAFREDPAESHIQFLFVYW